MQTMNRLATLLLLLLPTGLLRAQDGDGTALPVTTATYQIGLGSDNVLDTYLSMEKFSGPGLTFLFTTEREKPDSRWTTLTEHQASFTSAQDRAEKVSIMQADYSLLLGHLYQWHPANSWTLQAGCLANGNIGFVYNTSNSNNPAQARLSLQLMPTAVVSKEMQLLHRFCKMRYELQLPLASVMFSPNYGQSYYEIFALGNYDRNIVPTTFVATPNLRQQLTVGYSISRHTMLTVGYLGDYQQAKVNNLKSHVYHHRVMVGFVTRFAKIRLNSKAGE